LKGEKRTTLQNFLLTLHHYIAHKTMRHLNTLLDGLCSFT